MGTLRRPPVAAFLLSVLLLALFPYAALSARAADPPAYVALGDSLAFGVGAPDPGAQGYVALIYNALQASERYGQSGLALANLSAPGATSADLLAPGGQLERALGEITQRQAGVDVISIGIGANDLLSLAEQGSPCISNAAADACLSRLGEVLGGVQLNLREVLQRLREATPDAQIYVLDLYNPFSGTGDLRESLADIGVQQVNGVIRAVASEESLDVQLVSLFGLFQGRGQQWVAGDGLHPNVNGYRAMAEALLSAIEKRPLRLPEDLAVPTDQPASGAAVPNLTASSDSRDNVLLIVIVAPVAFLAGAVLTAAYFLARGRG